VLSQSGAECCGQLQRRADKRVSVVIELVESSDSVHTIRACPRFLVPVFRYRKSIAENQYRFPAPVGLPHTRRCQVPASMTVKYLHYLQRPF